MLAAASGDPARAVKLQGAALALREAVGQVPSARRRGRLSGLLEAARGQLGQRPRTRCWPRARR